MSVDIEEIERRANAATPGPWTSFSPAIGGEYGFDRVVMVGQDGAIAKRARLLAPDATFIAAARTDVPALVAEVRRLRGLLRRAERAIGRCISDYNDSDDEERLRDEIAAALTAAQENHHG